MHLLIIFATALAFLEIRLPSAQWTNSTSSIDQFSLLKPESQASLYMSTNKFKSFNSTPTSTEASSSKNYTGLPPIKCAPGHNCSPVQFPADVNYKATNRSTESLLAALKVECPLWDTSCKGNYTAAKEKFFGLDGTKDWLIGGENHCFINGTSCAPNELKEYAAVKEWMRTEECQKIQLQYGGINYAGEILVQRTCCNKCYLVGGNVQIFYWPEHDTDKSCLSVVGDKVSPLNHGATTNGLQTYWGCVSNRSTVTTANLTTERGVSYKTYLTNPWSSQPCPELTAMPTAPAMPFNTTLNVRTGNIPFASGRVPVRTTPSTNNLSTIVTAVSGSYTLWVLLVRGPMQLALTQTAVVPRPQFTPSSRV